MKRMNIPKQAEKIIEILETNGFEAYLVGGCVRDMLMERKPKDWDITTNAKPEEVKALFNRTIDTGIKHGTVTVMIDKQGYEVTTYRMDGMYEDNRHPKDVQFVRELSEDLRRRDFTIDAMAYGPTRGFVDMFGGQKDLQAKVIRCVGNAEERFSEDALRIMRAFRFAGQLGFQIEEHTLQAAEKFAPTLDSISAERVQIELVKLLVSPYPNVLLMAWEHQVTKVILPEFDRMMTTKQNNPHHSYTVGMHCMKTLENLHVLWEQRGDKRGKDSKDFQILCFAALLHDVAKPYVKTTDENGIDHFYRHQEYGEKMAEKILRGLKCDNETIERVKHLIFWHDYRYSEKKAGMRRAMNKIGKEWMGDLFLLQRCDVLAQNPNGMKEKLEALDKAETLFLQIEKVGECTNLKMLSVSGRDLIAAGCQPGKKLGEILHMLLEHVLDEPQDNEKQILMEIAQKLLVEKE